MSELAPEVVRQLVDLRLTQDEAVALASWYAGLAAGLAAFPEVELVGMEPPLRSVPGPEARAEPA